jgi:hypothetical protein
MLAFPMVSKKPQRKGLSPEGPERSGGAAQRLYSPLREGY